MACYKHIIYVFLISLFFVASARAVPLLDIQKVDTGSVVMSELDNPATFDFIINNSGPSDTYEIYSLVGVSLGPKGGFEIPNGESTVHILAYPPEEVRQREGFYTFEYFLRGVQSGTVKDTLTIRILSLKDSLDITAVPLSKDDRLATLMIRNTQNTHLENVQLHFSSQFFTFEKGISLEPYENVTIKAPVDVSKLKGLPAGPYIISAVMDYRNTETKLQGVIKYLEKEGTSVTTITKGYIVRSVTVTKTNEGNVPTTARIDVKKDIISRLFTMFSEDPQTTQRNGLSVSYSWSKDLGPGESYVVVTTTNYTFPFILILLVVLITLFAKIYSQTAIVVDKRVSFVKTKGGQFALKVRVHVKAKKHADNVQLIDRLPGVMKLYEKFGKAPDKVDESTRRLFWTIGNLNSGEERVFSYIIYTNVNVVGRFELPAATAVFERDGKTHEVLSNRTFFASESSTRKNEF